MTIQFGNSPYEACSYYGVRGDARFVQDSGEAADALKQTLEACKRGDFSGVGEVMSLMADVSFDVRQYAAQLFAHVCNHQQVARFEDAIEAAEDPSEMCRIAIRLGETLSLRAIPLLLAMQTEHAKEGVDGYVCTALRNILPLDEVSEDTLGICDAEGLYGSAIETLDVEVYYYRGEPVFVGNVTKELIQAVLTANRERENVVLVRQAQVLAHFSGVECPVVHGQPITDSDVEKVYDYVERLAKMEWHKGAKYFYRHLIR